MLGEPDYGYNDDELILVYKWQKIEGFSLIAIPIRGASSAAGDASARTINLILNLMRKIECQRWG